MSGSSVPGHPLPLDGFARALARHRARQPSVADRFLELVEARGPRVVDRTVFDPGHVTASGFVFDRQGRVLLVHHRRLDRWLQPGGHVDATDVDIVAAATREIAEETGLTEIRLLGAAHDPILDLDVHEVPARPGEPPHLHLDVRFAFLTGGDEGLAHDIGEVHDAAWVPVGDPRLSEPSLLRPVLAARRRFAGELPD